MTRQPLNSEQVKELQYEMDRDDQLHAVKRKLARPERIRGERDSAGLALARAANRAQLVAPVDDLPALEEHIDLGPLERDGCEYIDGLYFYLHRAGCPAAAREFVSVICGISGGTSEEFLEITDPEIADRMGVSLSTVGYRRRSLIKWMERANFACIGIEEGEWDTTTGKNRPTKYRVSVVPIVAEVVARARAKVLYDRSRKGALRESAKEAHTKALIQATDELIDDTPETKPVKHRQEKKAKTVDAQIKSARKSILTLIYKCCVLERKQHRDPRKFFLKLMEDAGVKVQEAEQLLETDVRLFR